MGRCPSGAPESASFVAALYQLELRAFGGDVAQAGALKRHERTENFEHSAQLFFSSFFSLVCSSLRAFSFSCAVLRASLATSMSLVCLTTASDISIAPW